MDLSKYLKRLHTKEGKVFDPVRKRWLIILPEELVRQTLLIYLTEEAGCAISRLSVEKAIRIHDRTKRFDLVYYSRDMKPLLLVECKSPSTPLTPEVLEQAVWYNYQIKAPYLLLSNGRVLQWYTIDTERMCYDLLIEPPDLGCML